MHFAVLINTGVRTARSKPPPEDVPESSSESSSDEDTDDDDDDNSNDGPAISSPRVWALSAPPSSRPAMASDEVNREDEAKTIAQPFPEVLTLPLGPAQVGCGAVDVLHRWAHTPESACKRL
jgi:hypothetical protein